MLRILVTALAFGVSAAAADDEGATEGSAAGAPREFGPPDR
jgi:hypothetical protein